MKKLFVTGTDTEVGKTYITCRLLEWLRARGFRPGVVKPAVTGAVADPKTGQVEWEDLKALRTALGRPEIADEWIGPFRWEEPLAPPAADRVERKRGARSWSAAARIRPVELNDFVASIDRWLGMCDVLLIEGAGGWLCPLTERQTIADLVGALDVPVLVVARSGLGTINHTLLTLESIRARGVRIAGVLLNTIDPGSSLLSRQTSAEELRQRAGTTVFGPLSERGSWQDLATTCRGWDWLNSLSEAEDIRDNPLPQIRRC